MFPLRCGNSQATTCQARTNNDCVPTHCCQLLLLCHTWFPTPMPISKNISLGLATQHSGPYQQVENTIGNLGWEVCQHSNPFMNLSQHGLLCAQTNVLKAIVPELAREPPLPCNAEPISDGYVLLTARDDKDHSIRDVNQIHALIEFFTQNGEPGRIPLGGKFSL